MVNEGLIITGNPIDSIFINASLILLTNPPFAVGILISSIAFLNSSLFSAFSIDATLAPNSSILYFLNMPFLCSLIAISREVCPPTVGKIASGFSFIIISSILSVSIGSK